MGVAAGYMIFIGMNFMSGLSDLGINPPAFVKLFVVPGLPCLLVLLRTYNFLARVASIGVFCVFLTITAIIIAGPIYSEFQPIGSLDSVSVSKLPDIAGIASFLLCIHPTVISMAEEAKTRQEMHRVTYWGCFIVVSVNLTLALYGYLLWGADVNSYVFCNVKSSWIVTTIKFLLTVELLCSIPLVLKPNSEILEKNMGLENGGGLKVECKRNVVRITMVFASYALTVGVPVFQTMLGLIGGVCASAVGFVIPPIVHAKLLRDEDKNVKDRKFLIGVDIGVAIMGFIVMGWTAFTSLKQIIADQKEHAGDNSEEC